MAAGMSTSGGVPSGRHTFACIDGHTCGNPVRLVIGGGPPSYIPQDWVAELARQIPGARMETIPVGDLIHNADPEAPSPAS